MKRALRIDKIRIAALEATLKLYRDPDRLAQRLPTVRLFARPQDEIKAVAERMKPAIAKVVGPAFSVEIAECASQIGSGALPLEGIPSFGVAIRSVQSKGSGRAIGALSIALRKLPVPVVGHIADQSLVLDMRCLEDEASFVANLSALRIEDQSDAMD
jgi:L-seryl-tRNA(Ser) seleniumtransferase